MGKEQELGRGFNGLLKKTTEKVSKQGAKPKVEEPKKEKMVMANYRLPESLHKKFKILAIQEGKTQQTLISELLTKYLESVEV